MKLSDSPELIKAVAIERGYKVTAQDKNFEIYTESVNKIAFQVLVASSSGYIQIHLWDEGANDYGHAVYSLRELSDVIQFCNIMISSLSISARRQD